VETERASVASDHASFWRRGYPAVLVAEDYIGTPGNPDDPGDFNGRLHSLEDRADALDGEYHAAIARAAVATLARLAGPLNEIPLPPPDRDGFLVAAPPVPNPARTFRIPITLESASPLDFTVVDAAGRSLWRQSWERREAGPQSLTWPARDASGRSVPSGVYFFRLNAGRHDAAGRMIVIR
jgi:hypothetical protein